MKCTVVSNTYDPKEDVKRVYSNIDTVERGGYIPNDKKIESFINSGLVLTEMRRGAGEYDIAESESDFEEDSPEYLEELTRQAEDYKEKPLAQFMDKITAVECLATAENQIHQSERNKAKPKRAEKSEGDRIVEAIKDLKETVKTGKAEAEPK